MDLQHPEQPGRETPPHKEKEKPFNQVLELNAPIKTSVANQVAWIMGTLFVLVGLLGFVTPGLFGAHLNPTHNILFLISGVLSFWMGFGKANFVAKRFCYWIGGFYALLGVFGFLFGTRALSMTRPTVSGVPEEVSFLWKVVPGSFELGTVDHVIHLVIAAVFLTAAYFTLRREHHVKTTWH